MSTEKQNCYTIQDAIADFFFPPFFAQNHDHAKRMFIQSMGDNFPHRRDFHLFFIGTFCSQTGRICEEDAISILAGRSIDESLDPRPKANQFQQTGAKGEKT